ncbi:hypothetical protein ADT26_04640 [Xanthomonas oryzae]|nr:hypothetical protein AXO1947_18505 [Xanthomonas oryzae pv. oryzae]KOR46985.1 hypothetical protein ADT26_04640 [Xanthomonas oryzae]AUI89287.1 hypothetical protein BVV16_01980 [Xanthomonas oryzae pv. oryzae]AUI92961.1 hypothetical protein BVV17_01980 [Xanthomonas oryzae pv. oryzae]AUI96634.1 hypothetical protein BVV18_01985 [Xanthomonas oryzae pv. oryzae]
MTRWQVAGQPSNAIEAATIADGIARTTTLAMTGHGRGEVALDASDLGTTHRLLPPPLGGAMDRSALQAHLHVVAACTPSTMRG